MTEEEITSDERAEAWGRRSIEISERISNKLDSMGVPHSRSVTIGSDLADIYLELAEHIEYVDNLLASSTGDDAGSALVGVKTGLEHINYHTKHVRRALDLAIDHCHSEEPEDNQ